MLIHTKYDAGQLVYYIPTKGDIKEVEIKLITTNTDKEGTSVLYVVKAKENILILNEAELFPTEIDALNEIEGE